VAVEVARLVAKLEADVRDFDRDMRKATKRLDGLEKSTRKAGGSMKKADGGIQRMTGSLKKMAAVAGVAFAAKKVLDFGRDAVRAASDLEESVNAVEVTFGEASAGILQLGEDAATSVGLANSEFNSLAVGFSAFVDKIDQGGGNVVGIMDDLTTRVADFASVMNLEVGEAGNIFRSALAGETEAIRRFGVDVSAAAVTTKALALGLGDSSGALSEQDKILARYQLVMEQTDKTAGDFANTSESLANQQRIFAAELENTKAEIGEALLPVMAELLQTARDLLPAFKQFAEGLAETFTNLGPVIQGVGFLIGKLGEVSSSATNAADEMRNPFSALGAFLAEALTQSPVTTFTKNLERTKSVIDGSISGSRAYAKSVRLINEAQGNNRKQAKAFSDGLKDISKAGGLTKTRIDELADAAELNDDQLKRLLLTSLQWAEANDQSGESILALRQAMTELVRSITDGEQAAIAMAEAMGFTLVPMDDVIGRTQDIRDAVLDGMIPALTEAEVAVEELTDAQKENIAKMEDARAATEDYRDALSDLVGTSERTFTDMASDVESFLTGFEKLPDRADITMEEFIHNFQERADEMTEFWTNLGTLVAMGNEALADELRRGGPEMAGLAADFVGDPIQAAIVNGMIAGAEGGLLQLLARLQGFVPPPLTFDARITTSEPGSIDPPPPPPPFRPGGGPGGTGLADGGPAVAGRPYIVGERGPELFTPRQSGTVTPNNQLSGSQYTFNQTFERVEGDNIDEDIQRGVLMAQLLEKAEAG
jgi:hypothetical protein